MNHPLDHGRDHVAPGGEPLNQVEVIDVWNHLERHVFESP